MRTRQLFADRGLTTVVIDAPSDMQSHPYLSGNRQTAEHVTDVKAVIAWLRDSGKTVTKEAAMAKMAATEGAQQVIDAAVQLWGGRGVVSDEPVERLYREIRALRIYEGATEVQKLIIARELLKE